MPSEILPIEYKDLELRIKVFYEELNDGIGPYEFWGQKCFDKGTNYIDISDWQVLNKQAVEYQGFTKEDWKEIYQICKNSCEKWATQDIPDKQDDYLENLREDRDERRELDNE